MTDTARKSRDEPFPLAGCGGRVGVFRALYLGDMLCAIPSLRALRGLCPHARITLIGLPWAADFIARYPHYVDDFLPFPGHPQLPETEINTNSYEHFVASFPTDFEWLIQLHGDGRITNVIMDEWPAQKRAGFVPVSSVRGAGFFPYPAGHEVDRLLSLVRRLGGDGNGDLEFPVSPEDVAELKKIPDLSTLSAGSYVVIHAGGRAAERRLRTGFFREIVTFLAARTRVVLTGTQEERALIEPLATACPGAINAAGLTSLGALAALIRDARFLVTNDTGPSHLSAALRTPSLVIVAGSDPDRWAPRDRTRHRVLDARAGLAPGKLLLSVANLWQEIGGESC